MLGMNFGYGFPLTKGMTEATLVTTLRRNRASGNPKQ